MKPFPGLGGRHQRLERQKNRRTGVEKKAEEDCPDEEHLFRSQPAQDSRPKVLGALSKFYYTRLSPVVYRDLPDQPLRENWVKVEMC